MALYAYYCNECHQAFDVRKPISESSDPSPCPACGTANTRRLISTVAVFSSSGGQTRAIAGTPSCAGCSMSGCGCTGGSCRR